MADFGALSSLGAGSGVLTYDVIDKLKKADESVMIKPFETRLLNIQNKEKALSDLTTQISLFKSSFVDFKNGDIFQKRLANITGSSVTASVNSGVKVQTITMDVKQLAQNDIYQSKGYDSEDSTINDTGDEQIIKIAYGDGDTKEIKLKDGATLSDLKDAINEADVGITASIIDTGSDENPYKLILKGNETGKDNIIKLDFGKIDDLDFNQTIYQSKKYDSDSDKINDSGDSQEFKIKINGVEYKMDVADGESVKDFIDDINNDKLEDADGNKLTDITAEFKDGKIQFHIQHIGEIEITDDNLTSEINDNTDFDENNNRVQKAQNSEFKYNGVDIERDSNKIDDLVIGLTTNLQSTGLSTIHIEQDKKTINQEVQDFVNGYNSIVSKIQELTKYDEETKVVGLFQNESAISAIPKKLSGYLFNSFAVDVVTKTDRNGEEYQESINLNASDFGFGMNRTGFLDFNSSKFSQMLDSKPEKVEEFLSGDEGAFTKIFDYIDSLTKGSNSTLELLNSQYHKEEKSYQETIENSQKRIDLRYQTMAAQFASYDSMINSFNVQAETIDQAIKAMIASK